METPPSCRGNAAGQAGAALPMVRLRFTETRVPHARCHPQVPRHPLREAVLRLLIVPFVLWGVADVAKRRATAAPRWPPSATQQDRAAGVPGGLPPALPQVIAHDGRQAEPTPAIRRGVAGQTLERLIIQAGDRRRGAAPGPRSCRTRRLRQAVFEIPAFSGRSRQSSTARSSSSVLRQNNLTEAALPRPDARPTSAQRQLMEAVQVGASTPETAAEAGLRLPARAARRRPGGAAVHRRARAAGARAPTTCKRAYEDDPQRYSRPGLPPHQGRRSCRPTPSPAASTCRRPTCRPITTRTSASSAAPRSAPSRCVVAQDEAAGQQARRHMDRRGRLGRDAEGRRRRPAPPRPARRRRAGGHPRCPNWPRRRSRRRPRP